MTPLVGILKPTILGIPHLAQFLIPWGRPVDFFRARRAGGELSAIAGWGFKPTAEQARREAAQRGLPYLALEDGFLRSLDLGVAGAPPWSVIVDDVGMHYDATLESRIERLIAKQEGFAGSTVELLGLLRRHNLSKYNNAPDLPPAILPEDGRPLVLIVDQTAGDMSVGAGGASPDTFSAMLDAALAENPDARVVVRVHPDVVSGRRRGFLAKEAVRRRVPLLAHPANWPSIARQARRVYTVTSLAGLEALIVGTPVTCFGLPFYAGWGLTEDRLSCPRRRARPSLEALVAAAYEAYPRNVDPVQGQSCDAVALARHIAAARAAALRVGENEKGGWRRRFAFLPPLFRGASPVPIGIRAVPSDKGTTP